MLMSEIFASLCQSIGYSFKDENLLRQALTHRSASDNHNERLEFLGDAVLGLTIAAELFKKFPAAREGQMSRMRSSLVKGETLAEVGVEFKLGEHLILGGGESKNGGKMRNSILEDAIEGMIGAVFLDSDFETTQAMLLKWFASRLKALTLEDEIKDAKSLLQEWTQARGYGLPHYQVTSTQGAEHSQTFTMQCRIADVDLDSEGTGKSKKASAQSAAEAALKQLGETL
jgi:ribonuclease-3